MLNWKKELYFINIFNILIHSSLGIPHSYITSLFFWSITIAPFAAITGESTPKSFEKYAALFDPLASKVDTDVLMYQVPGGMLSNLVSQLKQQSAIDKYEDVLKEIPKVRKDLGYPPLVTPTSQIVGVQSVKR